MRGDEASGTIRSVPERAMLTYADYAAMPDDGLRHELVDGELFVTPSPGARHQDLVLRFAVPFSNHLERYGGGRLFVAPFDVVLSDHVVVQPDLVFVADAQRSIITPANIRGVPALLIEVLSDPRHDRVRKRDLYARFGVPEYWIADGEADRVEVNLLDGNRYGKPRVFEPGDLLEYAGLPGLSLDLAKLLSP